MAVAPQPLTVIISGSSAPKIWIGHINDQGIQAYLDGLELARVNHAVEFHHMLVYSDIGTAVNSRTFFRGVDGWIEAKQ